MNRLTHQAIPLPRDTFCFCQLCGTRGTDITEFVMLQECDEQDKPEAGNYLIRCKSPECCDAVDIHERLYMYVPWGQGEAGALMLLCGGCGMREGNFNCKSPRSKKNGGGGLVVIQHRPFNVHVCTHDDITSDPFAEVPAKPHLQFPAPYTRCNGRSDMDGLPEPESDKH